ncbi:putative entry exclusion protein TrbK-alt [Agrobacterium tumefaciens]|uniref:putative entry exclusion protein TrbK-alt n=1 Tax=Agrobacterium tumefaciens TaxID=358 RepID=UPI000EF587E0|nr:putative entry exclusion protein TrbK-alt [Agrobacterium tumefaciens]AYM83999.1 conjugal transfer protein TrbK [Agrobacterium tumefaciens]NTE90274.1 putative entry exclusion protein TrbK-alt [Agrobacterium tumefaciens]
MDTKIAARMIAVFAIGAGLTAAITALYDNGDRPDAQALRIERPGGDPAPKGELGRCRGLGTAALEDPACRKAWAENRHRFFQMNKPRRPTPPKSQSGNGATGIDKETGRE